MPKNNNPLIFDLLIVGTYSCKSKCINKNKNISKMVTKNSLFYYTIINKSDGNNLFILVFLMKSIHNYKNKGANIKNNNNRQDKILLYIYAIKR